VDALQVRARLHQHPQNMLVRVELERLEEMIALPVTLMQLRMRLDWTA
jgi:hypothetical protein